MIKRRILIQIEENQWDFSDVIAILGLFDRGGLAWGTTCIEYA